MASTLIMASHSHTMAGRLIMGSNADYLLHQAHCSMYIFKNYELDNHLSHSIDFPDHKLTTQIISRGNFPEESGALRSMPLIDLVSS